MDDFNNNNDFSENKDEQNYGANLMPQSGGSQPQNSIDPQYDYSQYQYNYDGTAAPKKSNGWVVPAVIAGVLVVGAAGALLMPSVRNSVKLAFTSPEEYYAEAERKTAEKAANDLWKLYLIGEEQQKEAASPTAGVKKTDITITPGDHFYESLFPDNKEIKDIFKSVGISAEAATGTDLASALCSVKLNDTTIASAEVIGDLDNTEAYVRLVESSSDMYYKYTAPESGEDGGEAPDISVLFNGETVTKEKIDAVTARYTDLYLSAVTAAEWNKKSVCTVENVSCPAVEVRITFTEAEYLALIEKIAEQAKTDEDIISIVEAMGGRREDYVTEIDELLSDMNLEASDELFADMTVYINSDGDIIGRTFRDNISGTASEYTISTAVNNGAFASQMKLATTEGESAEILLKGSYANGSASGYCDGILRTLEDEASSSEKYKTTSCRIGFENVKYDFLDSRLYGGKYTFTSPELEEIEASMELDGDMDNGSCNIAVTYEGENYVNVSAVYTSTDEVRSISLPSADKCSENTSDIISEDYIEILMDNVCKAAGVSEDRLSEIIFGVSASDDSWEPQSDEEEYNYGDYNDYGDNGDNDYSSEAPFTPALGDYENITLPSVDLSNAVYTANGKEITIPCKGLALPDKFVRTETPLEAHTGDYFFNNDYTVMIYIENEKNSTYNADVCQCKYFSVLEGGEASLDLRVNGIGIGSPQGDIEAALGTPSDIYDFNSDAVYYYYYDKSSLTVIELVTDGYEVYSISVSSNIKYMD